MEASYDATLPDVRSALTNSLHDLLTDLSVRMLEQATLNCLQGSSSVHAPEPANCPVLQSAFQMMQKLMALDQEQVIEFKGTALYNFLPQSLKWEISFVNLMRAWPDVELQQLQAAISDYATMASSQNGHDKRLSPIQLYFQANDVATALLACARQHVHASEHKVQQQQLHTVITKIPTNVQVQFLSFI